MHVREAVGALVCPKATEFILGESYFQRCRRKNSHLYPRSMSYFARLRRASIYSPNIRVLIRCLGILGGRGH